MATDARFQRMLTVQFRVPEEVTFTELTLAFWKQFGKESISCCQPRGKGVFHVTFCSLYFMNAVRAAGLLVSGTRVFFTPLEEAARWITVRNAPFEMPSATLKAALAPFGDVLDHEFVVPKETAPVTNGNRRVRLKMKKPVPNFLKVGLYQLTCAYPGVVRLCRRCNQEGHLSAACSTPFCNVCRVWGHPQETCPAVQRQAQWEADRDVMFPALMDVSSEEPREDPPTPVLVPAVPATDVPETAVPEAAPVPPAVVASTSDSPVVLPGKSFADVCVQPRSSGSRTSSPTRSTGALVPLVGGSASTRKVKKRKVVAPAGSGSDSDGSTMESAAE